MRYGPTDVLKAASFPYEYRAEALEKQSDGATHIKKQRRRLLNDTMIRIILQVFCAIFSGAMEAFSISNELLLFGSPALALFSLAPLYVALYRTRSCRESFFLMALQTLTVHMISSFWLAFFKDFAVFTLGASALGTAFEGGLCGIALHLYTGRNSDEETLREGGGRRAYRSFSRMLWFSAAWVFWEWIKSTGFLAYPWGTLSMAAYRWKIFTQVAAVTGVWGVSFLWALANALIGEGVLVLDKLPRAQNRRLMASSYAQAGKMVAAVAAACAVYGLVSYFMPRTPVKHLNTVIVQQNIDPWEVSESSSIEISKHLTENQVSGLKEAGKKADLVLWSEGVLTKSFPNSRFTYENFHDENSLGSFVRRMDVPFIIGGQAMVDREKRHHTNAAVLFASDGTYAGFYSKMHLVPFAEAIPYGDSPIMRQLMSKVARISSGWAHGRQLVLFRIPLHEKKDIMKPLEECLAPVAVIALDRNGYADSDSTARYLGGKELSNDAFASFTTPICFEDAFSDVCSRLYALGSEVFMNITNDSWSKTPSAEYQHFVVASYRAIEYRTTLVRCANSGYSVVVDPAGRIIADIPVFTEAARTVPVPIYRRSQTIYARFGDWFAYLLFSAIGLYCLWVLKGLYIPAKQRHGWTFTLTVRYRTAESSVPGAEHGQAESSDMKGGPHSQKNMDAAGNSAPEDVPAERKSGPGAERAEPPRAGTQEAVKPKKRGRPKKTQANTEKATAPRKRGRPRKQPEKPSPDTSRNRAKNNMEVSQ